MEEEPKTKPQPIVIRAPATPPATSKGRGTSKRGEDASPELAAARPATGEVPRYLRDKTRLTMGLGITILGAVLADLTPFLAWWRVATVIDTSAATDIPSLPGRASWQGLVCLLGGVVLLSLAAVWNSGKVPTRQRRYVTGAIVAAGVVVVAAGLMGVFFAPSIGQLHLRNTVWIWFAILGGVVAATGGVLLQRESHRPAVPPEGGTAPSPAAESHGGFLISSMDAPPDRPVG